MRAGPCSFHSFDVSGLPDTLFDGLGTGGSRAAIVFKHRELIMRERISATRRPVSISVEYHSL
jgi:hypothetical protein